MRQVRADRFRIEWRREVSTQLSLSDGICLKVADRVHDMVEYAIKFIGALYT